MSIKTMLLGLTAVASLTVSCGTAMAGQLIITSQGKTNAEGIAPKFAMIRRLQSNVHAAAPTALPPTWVYSYTYSGTTFNETFIGTPASGGASTTVPIYLVPVALKHKKLTEDPTVITANGVSVIQNVLNSILFQSTVDYVQGGTDLGTTQYEDAFQRATLWGTVSSNKGYHVLLGTPTVEPVQLLTVPPKQGSKQTAFGAEVLVANINWFDPVVNALIVSLKIPSDALPLFITSNSYLSGTKGLTGCCIGGYHSVTNAGQPYSVATYITTAGAFSQDISALSHELGEWIDDPNTNNAIPAACGKGAILEVGDPLEGLSHYGTYPYTVGGVTWHPQDLVLLQYFEAPSGTSVNNWTTFQGETVPACSRGG